MSDPEPPEFGIVDLVDAFTALRHEYRSHVRQNREVGETIQQAVEKITRVADSGAGESTSPDPHKLIMTMIDLDIQLSRAIDAVTRSDEVRRQRAAAATADFQRSVQSLSPIGRYFAAGLIRSHHQQVVEPSDATSPIADGLIILAGKVTDALVAAGVEKIETTGQPFDGTLMRSVGVVENTDVPPGHVAQELSPAYRNADRVLQFANVRVA